jgi:Dolichyl-phosphate-mannose-protein mannosyltransferase
LRSLNRIFGSGLRREYTILGIVILLSASYAYLTMANSQLYIDEITYARLGYSLLQGHLASDSALLPIYQKFGAVRSDIYTPLGYIDSVEPWLDHPPLVPLLLAPILITGASPRLLPIIFSSMTTLLIFFILRDRRVLAWASSLIWVGFFITHPILSMLFVDSGVAFFNLLTVALTNEYAKSRSTKPLYMAGIAAGASTLSKLFGVASLLYLLTYLIYARFKQTQENPHGNYKPLLLGIGIASIWPAYGLTTAAPLFIQLVQFNVSRSILSDNIFNFPVLASLNYTKTTLFAGGIDLSLAGWVGMAYSLSKKNLRVAQISPLCYLVVVLGLRYAWFYTLIPLYPFFAIGIGTIVTDVICVARKRLHPRRSSDRFLLSQRKAYVVIEAYGSRPTALSEVLHLSPHIGEKRDY